jgi:signal peptidase I
VVLRVKGFKIPLIKRVIGLPGETVEIHNNCVYIDGEPLKEDYLSDVQQPDHSPVRVDDREVFVLGDNRGVSNDSRYFGCVPAADIVGRAWLSYWPLGELHLFR